MAKRNKACQETTEARLECKEPTSEDMEPEMEYQEVSKEEAAVRSSGALKKQHRSQDLAVEHCQMPEGKDPRKLGIPEEIDCHRQEDDLLCRSGMAQGIHHHEKLDQGQG
jgi:hypothetical protein